MNAQPLTLGTASIKNAGARQLEAQLAAQAGLQRPAIFGSRKPAGIARISIVPAERRSTLPFDGGSAQRRPPGGDERLDDPPAGGWTLTLQGRLTKVLPIAKFPTTVIWDGTKAGDINPSLKYVYKGQSLYKLLAKVDDNKPGSFNAAKAKKGYTIQFYLP